MAGQLLDPYSPARLVAVTIFVALAACLVTALALWLPLAWPLRAAVAGLVYAVVMWITGIIAPGDRAVLRKAFRTPTAE